MLNWTEILGRVIISTKQFIKRDLKKKKSWIQKSKEAKELCFAWVCFNVFSPLTDFLYHCVKMWPVALDKALETHRGTLLQRLAMTQLQIGETAHSQSQADNRGGSERLTKATKNKTLLIDDDRKQTKQSNMLRLQTLRMQIKGNIR